MLYTDLFFKPTVRFNSAHPRANVSSLRRSQFLRVKRIVAENERLTTRLEEMTTNFAQRGYPPDLRDQEMSGVSEMDHTGESTGI